MSQSYEQLVAAFKELMERGDKDQWKLAEIAYLASDEHGGIKQFAADTGYKPDTISKYKRVYEYIQREEISIVDTDITFADAFVLASTSEDRGAAIRILASVSGKSISSVKDNTEDVNVVKAFLVENPELVQEALKDDGARSAVASAAFKAASETVVAEATGITKEAAKEKAPKKNQSHRAVEVEQLKYKATMAGRWALGNIPTLVREVEALAPYMTHDEMGYIYEQLGSAYDLIAGARVRIDELLREKV